MCDSLRIRAIARNVSFRISLRWPIHIINPIEKTKLPYYTSKPTLHHSFLRNLPLYPYASCCKFAPCSAGFSTSTPIFRPPEKPTSTNSNSTTKGEPQRKPVKPDVAFSLNNAVYHFIIYFRSVQRRKRAYLSGHRLEYRRCSHQHMT